MAHCTETTAYNRHYVPPVGNVSPPLAGANTSGKSDRTGKQETTGFEEALNSAESALASSPAGIASISGMTSDTPSTWDSARDSHFWHTEYTSIADVPPTESASNRLSYKAGEGGQYEYQYTAKDGSTLSIRAKTGEDLHIKESEDGIAVLNKATGEALLYTRQGEKSALDDTALFDSTDGDDVIINWTAKTVDTGEGDDTVLNFANGATINTGNGNDTLILHGATDNISASMGDGYDTVIADKLGGESTIDLGEGDSTLSANIISDSTVTGGNGKNAVTVGSLLSSAIDLGNGNNAVTIDTL